MQKILPCLPFFLLLLLNLLLKQTVCEVVNKNMIRDLIGTSHAIFDAHALKWTGKTYDLYTQNPGAVVPITANDANILCNGIPFLGLQATFDGAMQFRRLYRHLPPHEFIYYSAEVIILGDWYYDSSFVFVFDTQSYGVGVFLTDQGNYQPDICVLNDHGLSSIFVFGKAKHTGSSLELFVSSNHHSWGTKKFGFRDLTLLFRNETYDQEFSQMCANSNDPDMVLGIQEGKCRCDIGEWGIPPCQTCHGLCATCLGPDASQCLTCRDGAFFNGEECELCHASCETCDGPLNTDCLTCPAGSMEFTGGACIVISKCVPPLISAGGMCNYNCPIDEYLYTSQGCKDECPFTYDSFLEYGRQFCYDYCPAGQYSIPPRADITTDCVTGQCPDGYYQYDPARYCHPCDDELCAVCPNEGTTCTACLQGGVLNTDGICKACSSLQIQYIKATSNGHQYEFTLGGSGCILTAQAVQNELQGTANAIANFPPFSFQVEQKSTYVHTVNLIMTGSVMQASTLAITLNFLTGSLAVPKTLVPTPGLETIGELIPAAEGVIGATLGASLVGTVMLGATASLWSIINFQQFVGYFGYINVEFPYQLQLFFNLIGSAAFSFLPNPLASMTDNMSSSILENNDVQYRPPEKFAEDNVTSFFIDNGGGIISTNILILLLLPLVKWIRTRDRFRKSWLLKKIEDFLQWNVIIRSFLENGIPLILAIFLQFRIMIFKEAYVILSCLGALFSFGYWIFMTVWIVKIVYTRKQEHLEKDSVKNVYGTIYEGIHLIEPESKYYNILILFRGTLLVTLVVYFEEIPVLQITPLIAFNAGLVYYLFRGTEFEDKNLTKINRIKEILILLGEGFILCLNFHSEAEEYYNLMGWFAVVCFLTSLIIELAYIIILQIKGFAEIKQKFVAAWRAFWKWYKEYKEKRRKNKRKKRVRRISPENLELELRSSGEGSFNFESSALPRFGEGHFVTNLKDSNSHHQLAGETKRKKQMINL